MKRPAFYPILRAFTSIAVIGMLALGMLSFGTPARSAPKGVVVGFEDGQGKTLFLHDFKGKPILINLWATWCAPCVEEMPSLAQLQKDYAGSGLQVLALSEDDSLATVTSFYKAKNMAALTAYLDKGHAVWTALKARGVPTSILINRSGQMVQRIEGPVDWQSAPVRKLINQIAK